MLHRPLQKTHPFAFATALFSLAASGWAATPAAAPNLKAIDGAGLRKTVASQKGKVTVVNLWATWCGPCLDEFPEFVKLYDQYKSKGVTVIAASLDEPEDKAKVAAFISKEKATFPVFMRTTRTLEEFILPLDKKWTGGAPTTYIFDRKGKLVGKPIVSQTTYAELAKAISPLLK